MVDLVTECVIKYANKNQYAKLEFIVGSTINLKKTWFEVCMREFVILHFQWQIPKSFK